MDPLLFLIKKHNYKKTVGCNNKLSYIMFINKNKQDEAWHRTHHMLYYIPTTDGTFHSTRFMILISRFNSTHDFIWTKLDSRQIIN